jgi:serine/threonine protein kinase
MEATPMSKSSKPSGNAPQINSAGVSGSITQETNSNQAAPKWLGKRLGRFRLQALIGQGAVGRVFRAEDTTLQRRVALKIISLYDRSGQINRDAERFVTEARAAAALEHPHVVQVYEAGESGKVCYIAMELLEGGSLGELVDASGPLDVHRACQLTAEAAEALAAAHAAGVIHRDVKPANLMLSRQGRCKVTDFGLATIDADDMSAAANADRNRKVGTALFVAPEVICGTGSDERSDMYSLGATLFYLLTGRPPFVAHGRTDAMRAHLEQPVPDVRAFRPGVPDGLAQAITKALDKDPGRRFGSMEQFSRLLRVYTIPIAGAAAAVAPQVPGTSPSQLSGASEAGPSGSGGLGMTGSFASSSDVLGAFGSISTMRSAHSSDNLPAAPAPQNRFATVDHLTALAAAAAKIDKLAAMAEAAASNSALQSSSSFNYPGASQIPVATIVQNRRILGLPLAAFGGILGGVAIAAIAVGWVILHNSPTKTNAIADAVPAPQVAEPILAAEREAPSPPITAAALPKANPPVQVSAPPLTPAVVPVTVQAVAPPPAVAVKVTPPTESIAVPPGVLHPWDANALKLIADGKDPAHPDLRTVVQGKVVSAFLSSTGKVFHIRFQGLAAPDAFEVVYFETNNMFEKMDAAFNNDVTAALTGKTIRVSGKLRDYKDTYVQMVPDSPERVVIIDKP